MSKWAMIWVIAVIVAVVLMLKKSGGISAKDALARLRDGALVIDVRTPGEFNSGHLPEAINIPLDALETELPRRVEDKNRVLLLHCQSGMRSGIAQRKLQAMGYPNTRNLGSFSRAREIVGTAGGN